MKLYEIPRGSLIYVDGTHVTFHRLDGAYSVCTTAQGTLCHLSASTPLTKVDGGYRVRP